MVGLFCVLDGGLLFGLVFWFAVCSSLVLFGVLGLLVGLLGLLF